MYVPVVLTCIIKYKVSALLETFRESHMHPVLPSSDDCQNVSLLHTLPFAS